MRRLVLACALFAACKGKAAEQRTAPRADDARPVVDTTGSEETPVDAAGETPARVEHDVWTAAHNRHLAHRYIDGELVLDARNASFLRYTRFSLPRPQWKVGATVDGERASVADKLAGLEVPLAAEAPPPTQVTVRVHATAAKQALELRFNGRKPTKRTRVPLEPGWQIVAFPVEPGALVAGENVIAVETIGKAKDKLAFSWFRIGTSHPAGDANPLAAATVDPDHYLFDLGPGAGLTWYLTIPEGAHLVGKVDGPCLVDVGARAGDASFAGGLLAVDNHRVDLSSMAGKVVRLSLTARDCAARVANPRITMHGPPPEPPYRAVPPTYVIVWLVKSLRDAQGYADLAKVSTVFSVFAWNTSDLTPLGLPLAKSGIDGMLARFDQHRDKPFAMLADTRSEVDPQLGRVTDQLKSWGVWDQTLLMVLGERGEPLVVHDPARFPAGLVIDDGADGSDLVPTVQHAVGNDIYAAERGLSFRADTFGESLVLLASGHGRGWPRPVYTLRDESLHTMRVGRWTIAVGETPVPIVIDSVDDPGEAVDLALVRPTERRMLTDYLSLFLPLRERWNKDLWGVVSNVSVVGVGALDEIVAPD